LVHGVISEPVDDEFLTLMRRNRAIYISTLALFHSLADVSAWTRRLAEFDTRGTTPKDIYERFQESGTAARPRSEKVKQQLPVLLANTRRVFEEGIPVITGTDTSIPGVLLGISSQMELVLHVEAGLKSADVLRCATINAQRMVGRELELGTVQVGKIADPIILDSDPLADIRNIRTICRVVKGGVVYDPPQVLAG